MSADDALQAQVQPAEIDELGMILEATKDENLLSEIYRSAGGRPLNSSLVKNTALITHVACFKKFGVAPTTLTMACAEAAGTSSIMYNMGAAIESIRIHPYEDGFTASVHNSLMGKVANINMAFYREVVSTLSAFAALRFMQMAHPSSLVTGKTFAAIYCHELSRRLRKEPEYFFLKALEHVHAVIAANRSTFNSVVYQLSKTGRLNPQQAKDTFKTFRLIPLTLKVSGASK